MAIPEAVAAWFKSLQGEAPADPGENPEPVAESTDEANAPAEPTAPEAPEAVGVGENPATEPDAGAAPEADPTMPEPSSGMTDAERDGANDVAAQNEELRLVNEDLHRQIDEIRAENDDLRDRLAALGGDAALGVPEDTTPDPAEFVDDSAPEYDAEADIAAQQEELAALRGE